MTETTDHPAPAAEPAATWCSWHRGPSETAVLVQFVEQSSGPGHNLFACAPCREQHGLTPVDTQHTTDTAYRAILQHLETCTAECAEAPTAGPMVRCPEGAALHLAHRVARDAVPWPT